MNPIDEAVRDFGVNDNKPVILEHHGIKEIISTDDLMRVRNHELEICDKCTHYNCLCEYRSEKI